MFKSRSVLLFSKMLNSWNSQRCGIKTTYICQMLYTKYIICAVNSCGFVVVFCFIVFIKALKAALSLAPNGGTGVAKKNGDWIEFIFWSRKWSIFYGWRHTLRGVTFRRVCLHENRERSLKVYQSTCCTSTCLTPLTSLQLLPVVDVYSLMPVLAHVQRIDPS